MTPRLFDESTDDLADLADIRAINAAAEQYRCSPHGLRRSRYRRLQLEIHKQLVRNTQEGFTRCETR